MNTRIPSPALPGSPLATPMNEPLSTPMNEAMSRPMNNPEHEELAPRQRQRRGIHANDDPFYIPPHLKDPNRDYNFKNHTVAGEKQERTLFEHKQQGWRPCDHSMFPGYFAEPGTTGPVLVRDMILMERPMHLTIEAQMEDKQRANLQVTVNERTFKQSGGSDPYTRGQVNSSREPIPIPE